MKLLRILSRVIVGLVFVFSGFVKAVDPLGSAYKFGDYFSAFSLGFLHSFSLPLSVFLSAVEFTIGVALLIGYRMKLISWSVLTFMSFFTVLTLILAIYNPVSDCGCFGDALILTNWETFYKNIIILVFVLVVFFQRDQYAVFQRPKPEWLVIALIFVSSAFLSLYAYNNLPPLDFRPYGIGSNLPEKMIVPADAPRDEYETILIYSNKQTGKDEEFSLENFPKDTTLYTFVDANSKLISKGYEPPVHDFSVTALGGTDITDIILGSKNYSFLLISHDLNKADKEGLQKAELLARYAQLSANIDFYTLTASSASTINELKDSLDLSFEFYQMDEITLKTIVRANPGLVLLKNGTVIGKWHFRNFPVPEKSYDAFIKRVSNFPFSTGADLNKLNTPPPGAASDNYETVLIYKNTRNDSLANFSISDFPQSSDWVFISSRSVLLTPGFKSPLKDFNPLTPEGIELSNEIINSRDNVFLALVNDPSNIDPELLNRVNNLSVMASAYENETSAFYLLTGQTPEELIEFSQNFISPLKLASLNRQFISRIAGNGIALVRIKGGIVMDVKKDKDIPEPSALSELFSPEISRVDGDSAILPAVLQSYRTLWEKRFVYLFIFSIIIFGLLLRVYFEAGNREKL